jgi:two-component system OmpR family sensor kinase
MPAGSRQSLPGKSRSPEGRQANSKDQLASDEAASELSDSRQEVAELRQALRARDDFLAIAAHELRNPLTPISGLTQLALGVARKAEGTCPPRLTMMLEHMQVAVEEFIKRATSLLDLTRIQAGNLRLEPTTTDLSVLVLSVAQRYELTAMRGGGAITYDIKDGVSAVLDRLAVEEVVENLLSNALKYGRGKPVSLRLQSDGKSARLDVRDQGVGMEPEQQARIFERFEQVVAQYGGTGFGIGLWVANRLVTAMNGNITVSSRVGEGSTFTVMLPLRPMAGSDTYDAS